MLLGWRRGDEHCSSSRMKLPKDVQTDILAEVAIATNKQSHQNSTLLWLLEASFEREDLACSFHDCGNVP